MEFPRRVQSTQLPDGGDDDGRRFPDSTPPNAREPSPAPAQGDALAAALARRREELLWELHKMKIRREMLLCELVETERAMASRFAAARHQAGPATPPLPWPRGDLLAAAPEYAWRGAPWEGGQSHAPAAGSGDQESPCWRRSPSAVRIPVYPHVERSPSPPMPQGRPAYDGDRQERGGPSGSPAVAPNVEQSTPLPTRKGRPTAVPVEEAIADVGQALLGQGVTPGGRALVGQVSEEGEIAVDGHGMELLGESTASKAIGPTKPVVSITGDQNDERVQDKESITGRQTDERVQDIPALDEQKRVVFNDENKLALQQLAPERISSGVKRQLTAGTSPAKKPRSQEMINCSLCNVSVTSPQELVKHRASLLHRSNLAPLQSGNKATAATATAMNTEAAQHAEKKAAEKSELSEWSGGSAYYQQQQHSHLGGRKHREKPRAGGGDGDGGGSTGTSDRTGASDPGRKTVSHGCLYFCDICSVRCSSVKMMESHLAGRRHRERQNSMFM